MEVIAVPLSRLINDCLEAGIFPEELKKSRIIPIFKKGDPEELSNFRPIAIIPILAKIMESVMYLQLCAYFESNFLLQPQQFGFRRGKSTSGALHCLVEAVLMALESKQTVALTLCDLTKAFDCVSHGILIGKLERYGVTGVALDTMVDFLSRRKQVVAVCGAESQVREVPYGVPQGSNLGPLLFLIYINDLHMNGKALLFADDTTLIAQDEDPQMAIGKSLQLIEEAGVWFRSNKLSMNEGKTQNLLCTLRRGPPAFGGPEVRLLGFVLDCSLSWELHVNMVCGRLSKVAYLMRKLKNEIPARYLITAYHGLFHSHINYGIVIWGHASGCERILLLQKKVLRIITGSPRLEPCRPIFKRLRILTVHSQYVYSSLLHLKSELHRFQERGEMHSHNTRRRHDLNLPYARLTRSLNSYPMHALRIFNRLPQRVRDLPWGKFKRVLWDRLVDVPLYSLREDELSMFYGAL